MRCSDDNCGFETKLDTSKFCSECGSKLIAESSLEAIVILCNGKLENGSPCNAELDKSHKFCNKCGTKVDPQLFLLFEEKCGKCGTVFKEDSVFCRECGFKKVQQTVELPKQDSKITDNVKRSIIEEESIQLRMDKTVDNVSPDGGKVGNITILSSSNGEKTGNITILSSSPESTDQNLSSIQKNVGELKIIDDGSLSKDTDDENHVESSATEKIIKGISKGLSVQTPSLKEMDSEGVTGEDHSDKDTNSKEEQSVPLETLGYLKVFDESTEKTNQLQESLEKDGSSSASLQNANLIDTNISDNSLKRKKSEKENPNRKKLKDEEETTPIQEKGLDQDQTRLPGLKSTSDEEKMEIDIMQPPLFDQREEMLEKKKASEIPAKTKELDEEESTPIPKENLDHVKTTKPVQKSTAEGDSEPVFGQGKTMLEKKKAADTAAKPLDNASLFKISPNTNKDKKCDKTLLEKANECEKKLLTKDDKLVDGKNAAGNKKEISNLNNSSKDEREQISIDKNACADENMESADSGNSDIGEKGENESDVHSQRQKRNLRQRKTKSDANGTAENKKSNMNASNIRKTSSTLFKEVNKTADKTESKAQSTGKSNTTGERCVQVHFHVLVSDEFNFDPKIHKVVLRNGDTKLGGKWQSLDREMSFQGKVDKYFEMAYKLQIPAKLISHGDNIFEYKYCIVKPEKAEKSKSSTQDKGVYWELYYRNKTSGEHVNRILKLVDPWKNHDVWHQYDGVIMKEGKGLTSQFTHWWNGKNTMVKHACFTAEHFCHDLKSLSTSGESIQDVKEHLEMLMRCMKKIYHLDFKCFDEEKDFMAKVGNALLDKLMKSLNDQGASEKNEQTFTVALIIVFLMKNLKLSIETKMGQTLCQTLLVHPDPNGKECKEMHVVQKYFSQKRKPLKEALVNLGKQVATRSSYKDPSWLFLMPLIHFLSDVCKPYDKPDVDFGHDDRVPKWWGISHIGEDTLKAFKKASGSWTISKKIVLEQLGPLYAMDYLLPRTIMTTMELKDLKEVVQGNDIPLEICLAAVLYQLKTYQATTQWTNFLPVMCYEEKVIQDILIALVERLQGYFLSGDENLAQWKMSYKIAYQLLRHARLADRYIHVYCCAQILIHCLAVYDRVIDREQNMSVNAECQNVIKTATEDLEGWFKSWYNQSWDRNLESYLKWWNNIVAAIEIQSERIRNLWNPYIVKELTFHLDTKVCRSTWMMSQFVSLYCRQVDQFSPCIQECMSQAAFKAIGEGYILDYGSFTQHEMRRFGDLVSKLFIEEWTKVVKEGHNQEDEMILKHALRWPPFMQFLKMYYTDQKKFQLLSDSCLNLLHQAESALESRITALLTGAITVGNLNLIGTNDSKFPVIAEMLKMDKKHTKEFISNAIRIRKREIQAFRDQAELVTTFTSLCSTLSVDVNGLYATLKKQKDLEFHQVHEFCTPADIACSLETRDFKPKLCAFEISNVVIEILPLLHSCNRSNLFMKLWEKNCIAHNGECETLDDVVTQIWKPVKARWDNIAQSIENGTITFQDMERHLGRLYKDEYENMETEMSYMNLKKAVILERLDQLKKYRQLGACVKGAKVILKFKKEYKLKGDFEQIQVIAEHDQNILEMNSFDESVVKTCDFLKEVTDSKAKSLDAFVECGNLVKWLKESMSKSGLKELKVFVDLAFMSAGDEPMSIKKVQCLHSAVTGYGPLIFDLKDTADYKELLNICRIVWKDLSNDSHLPKKLVDTNRNLEWLKDIKKAHGSVEVTSLVQSDAINANGIYTVGRKAYKDKAGDENTMDLAKSLKLTVAEIVGKRQIRNYTFENLQDLQSRLMLVAGKAEKGSDNVNRFTSIFDSVIRLANVNIKLCSAGCVLFKDWTARFLCDRSKPVCSVLEFGQGEGSPTLKARRSETEDLVAIIPKIAKFMEQCLEDWLMYIKKKRKDYLHLNFFTVDQLVILQRELVKMCTDDQPSIWIYPLLSAVKRNCTPEDLLGAMTDAKTKIDGDVDMENVEEEEIDMTDESNVEENEDELRQAFIKELIDAGYGRKLAVLALEHIPPDQIEDGIVWCMNHEDLDDNSSAEESDERESELTQTQTTTSPRFEGWSQSTTSIQSLIRENIEGLKGTKGSSADHSLLEDLQSLWGQFLSSISSNIKDYLSLEHLGIILEKLAARETTRVFRKFPPGFQEGSPNLIICPQGELLNTTLSLYMLEKDQPLPQSDEILMCTPHTTIDEVDIFWRRAIFGGGKKIHCLVNADCLNFDVSDATERHLEQYIQETSHTDNRYRLVVVCGSDNEYRSRIVASLDKHRKPALPLSPVDLREYLARQLQQSQPVNGIKPASSVDFNRSTIRVVKSWRAGVGKTLYKSRRETDLKRLNGKRVKVMTIPLQEKVIDLHYVITQLLEHTSQPGTMETRLFHIDVAHEVQEGVDYLLFNLLVLGCLTDKTGFVWRRCPTDLYLIETLPLMILSSNNKKEEEQYVHQMFNILPDMTCRSPQDSVKVYSEQPGVSGYMEYDQLFDEMQFHSSTFQRPYQYLCRLDQARELNDVRPDVTEGTKHQCLQTLLRHCGVNDPSWAELHHFVWFLNTQLLGFESSAFVKAVAAEDLPGFAKFVLRFLIQMSKDFSTRSLKMSEESPGMRVNHIEVMETPDEEAEDENGALNPYQLRRTWESSPHPYLFFNADNFTFTFLGFYIERASGSLIDQQTGQVLERGIMQQNLYDSLVRNFVPIQENFDQLPRHEKIMKMCNVMGIDMVHDPDDTYELTTDNVKKIMAIYMRFRCDIPVIIMGETGCGKTRLVKFMCGLHVPPGMEGTVKNMILMKVHGGTTNADIIKKVREAEEIARKNVQEVGHHMYTVLFFDEANTTESIGLIKEIMCDKSMEGRKLTLCENLKMVAACNPYRKHSQDLIKKLEQAGLGYHVDADNTRDKLGRVPMRQLVYRVQPLPQSLLPLVWDFGQLNTQVEDLYIRQMVRRCIRDEKLPNIPNLVEVVSAILTASQDYMRDQKDECSFVSLRDVERVLRVMSWFYEQSQEDRTLFNKMDSMLGRDMYSDVEEEEEEVEEDDMDVEGTLDDIARSLVLSLGVCYHACLKTRDRYREHIAQHFRAPCALPGGPDQMEEEINVCQNVFLENVQLEDNIAKNMALKENLFMMVVCIELRIPLFLVGKPGSSKSLAKTIVSDAMQGNASRKQLFKELKQAQMVSFQCSPLSTPDGIVGTFRQCAQFQKDKDLDTFVSIVVLDEVGLAEDSPRMPLKTLHPLLEDGCQGDEKPEPFMKVAFIGISNWALDPAKMNRGILVQREVPDLEELINSARGICVRKVLRRIEPLIEPMCVSYLEVFKSASTKMREFYGLRDFYSLVKMVCSFAEKSKQMPTWHEMLHAIRRNFGGLEQQKVDPEKFFKDKLAGIMAINDKRKDSDPDCTAAGLIEACLFERNISHGESRYLLLLTENYGSLTILQQQILSRQRDIKPITIFGSSFRSDQEYTQVCRNINKIKVCMETGNTVVLLNLENLYESLYDALNQYYVYFGGERYVDLGLGTHRVKCPVHKKFRLIVVAEKQTVYEKFPIPLINRLEKHFLTINTMLTRDQQRLAKKLEEWARSFSVQNDMVYQRSRKRQKDSQKVGDVFMGFHDDTCSAIILHVWKNAHNEVTDLEEILREAKALLLWVTTPQAVVRLSKSALPVEEQRELADIYWNKQKHDSIVDYLHQKLVKEEQDQLFVQVTTHSKLLATNQKGVISEMTDIPLDRIMLLDTLSSFDTEQQFSNKIQQHLQSTRTQEPCLLIIQCDSGDINANLVACARYCVMDEYQKVREDLTAPVHVVFIVQLPNIVGGCYTGFQCGVWHSVHIDDLWIEDTSMPSIKVLQSKSVSKLIQDAVKGHVPMETNDEEETRETSETMDWQDEENIPTDTKQVEGMEVGKLEASSSHRLERIAPKGPLDIDEVIIGFEMAGKENGVHHAQTGSGKSLNVKNLIISCTQEALSMLKDNSENTKRTTERVALVLTLFHGKHLQGYELFLQGMCCLIASLLKEKDKNGFGAENWLTNEAARQENIQKAGTFRRSCLQTLESKISPILAGIIAHLDANKNLDILADNQSPWKQEMWLAVLNVPEALRLKYSDLSSPNRQSELHEVVVMTTGCEGLIFKAEMPFSWLIQKQLIEILRTPMPEDEEKPSIQEKIDFYGGVFEKTPIGKVLTKFSHSNNEMQMADTYLHDFVCMCYKALSEEEFELVSQSIRYLYNQMANEYDFGTLSQLLLCIHESYKTLAPRLSYFHTMNMVWPECSATIVKHKQEQPDHPMFQEEEFTFSTLCLLIEHLTPTKPELDQTASRNKWLNKVHTFRPVIEKVLRLHAEDAAIYGAHSYRSVHRARCLWNRVVVIKLFLEHVCVVEAEEAITVKHCLPLWKVLTDEANLKELKSLAAIEKILKLCNGKAIKLFLGKQEKCCFCEVDIEGPPIVLPCSDIFCDECYQNILAMGDNSCLKCQVKIQSNWTLERQTQNGAERKQLSNYQKRCNAFFMDVVSQLCFFDNTPPTDEVIDRLLEYITYSTKGSEKLQSRKVTKEMTIFNTGLDPNPVFRSFLLQLLMRTSEEKVVENMNKYLKQAKVLLKQPNNESATNESYTDFSLLVIQCLEDILSQKLSISTDTVTESTKCLRRARQTILTNELGVEKLYGLAEARIGLAAAAKALADLVQQRGRTIATNVRRLIEAAQDLCENGQTNYPRIYLVKYMCRRFGIDVYQEVCRSEIRFLMWIGKLENQENQRLEISDRYVLCGETYTQIREALTKVLIGEDVQHLDETLQKLRTAHGHTHVMLQLAVYREITCSLLYPQQQRKITAKEVRLLQNYIQNSQDIKNKVLLQRFLDNTLGHTQPHLTVTEGIDFRHQGLQTLLTHFLSVLSQLQGDRTLLHPLIGVMVNPQAYVTSFIPTMPQDELEEVKEALLAARRGGDENPVIYRCPNGHPYVIGNCGRPATVGVCKDCGSAIGGEGYQLRPGNVQHQGNDETQTGHILGHAQNRIQGPRPERQMTPLYCACVRLFTHLSMYLGISNGAQVIQTMISPTIQVNEVPGYIWQHIQKDLDDLQRCLERSIDDTFLLLHTIIDRVMIYYEKGARVNDEICKWNTKKGRNDWENQFVSQYLQPVIKDCDKVLQQANQRIVNDHRLGADPLLCLLYEIDTQQESETLSNIEKCPAVWRYRSQITLGHLTQEFEAKKAATGKRNKQLSVLDLFLKEEHYLRAIRCIPSILKLQRELFQRYQRKLEKAEIKASQITIGHIKREKVAGEDTDQLVEDFEIAWNICREALKKYLCPTALGGMVVPEGYCKPIKDDTLISVLLPAIKDEGLCSYALLDFLMRKQNDFLDKCATKKAKDKKRTTDDTARVPPMEVTSAHLISYNPQQDLLPLILANCQYSFEIGKGTKIEYDFISLERQIMDRFLFSKSKIDVGPFLQIDLMIYTSEFTDGETFKKLGEMIEQESLSSAVKTQICQEMKTLPELCQSLNNLDITISFLKSIGGNPDSSLQRFMSETLQMKITVQSQKARQTCLFKHIQALWLLLALEKSKKMAEHRQPIENICESVSPDFQQDLPKEIEIEFREFMSSISIDKLSELVSTLHEYILLRVAVRENRDDEDYVDTRDHKLRDWLMGYTDEQEITSLEQILPGFPEKILYKHCVHTWVTAYSMLYEKQTGDQKF